MEENLRPGRYHIDDSRVAIKATAGKTHVLVADSTGIATTGKGRQMELKWDVKCNFIKLHILADEESQKILAFRITDTSGGDAQSLPAMPDQALNKLGAPLEDGGAGQAASGTATEAAATGTAPPEDGGAESVASVEVDSVPADENTLVTTTEFMCDCGCCQTVATERRVTKVAKPPAAIVRADGGYDSRGVFSHCKKRGVRTNIRVVVRKKI